MDALCQMISKLCVLVCLCALCQQVLPSGVMRGCARLACGLMLLHIMLSQLLLLCAPQQAAQLQSGLAGWIAPLPVPGR